MKEKKVLRIELPNQENVLISPLNLNISYQSPKSEMDLIPFLDLVLIGFLFFMLSSRLVYAPGIAVDLPDADIQMLNPALVTDVLTVNKRGDNILFFFKGAIYDMESLQNLANERNLNSLDRERIILVKMDGDLSVQMQADLVGITKKLGYSKVQIAMEPKIVDR